MISLREGGSAQTDGQMCYRQGVVIYSKLFSPTREHTP